MLRLLLIGGLLYGAWTGVDGLLVNLSGRSGPDVVDIASLETGEDEAGRWVSVVGGTAHPTVLRASTERESGATSTDYFLVPFLSPSTYWEHYDESGELREGIAPEDAPRVAVLARIDPGTVEMDSLIGLEQAVLEGITARADEGVGDDDREIFREAGVHLAEDARILELGDEPRAWWINLLIAGGTLAGAAGIGATFRG